MSITFERSAPKTMPRRVWKLLRVLAVLAFSLGILKGEAVNAAPPSIADLVDNKTAYLALEKEDLGAPFSMHFVSFVKNNDGTPILFGGQMRAYYIKGDAAGKMGIGLATSRDGKTWADQGLVLGPTEGAWDNTMASFPGVWYENGTTYLTYEGSGTNEPGDIGLAVCTSEGGKTFTKRGRILAHNPTGWEKVNIGTPSLMKIGDVWYLYYHGYDGVDCRIGVASGTDLSNLKKQPNPIVDTSTRGWDEGTAGRRDIIAHGGKFYMAYEGSTDQPYNTAKWTTGFARADNPLGPWTKWNGNNAIPQTADTFGNDGPALLKVGGATWVYYRADGNKTWRARIEDGKTFPLTQSWEAESLSHNVGRAGGNGLSANKRQDGNAGFLSYGPYYSGAIAGANPNGGHIAVWRMATDNVSFDKSNLVRLEVVDADGGGDIIASRDVSRREFVRANAMQFFGVPFNWDAPRAGHRMELRTWWYGNGTVKLQTIGLSGKVSNQKAAPKKTAAEIAKAIEASRAANREYSQALKNNAAANAAIPVDPGDERTSFQSAAPWTPRVHINSEVAMVYGLGDLPNRIGTWRDRGYKIHVMTGVSWGEYQDYLYGRFDGINHEDEAQTDRSGNKISHGGDVYYMVPGPGFGRYLSEGVKRAIDAGAQSIHLEEPEFWVQGGYSDAFKREWRAFYNEEWHPPHSSIDAQYRASKLKYFLYGRALSQVFSFVRDYGKKIGRIVPCYVATHSLISYAQIGIVSPESSLLNVGCDGYIAQIWTGTARAANTYEGRTQERTFEAAFLEYGAMQNLVRASGRRVWYLNDPVEDDPNRDWGDYQRNWESTLVASLLQPEVWRYETMPWPQRPFEYKYVPAAGGERVGISDQYETELQSVLTALNDMKHPASEVSWESAGTRGAGVLVSDTMMFQRGAPAPSDARLSSFFGLAMPLVKRGIPMDPVQIENAVQKGFLANYKLLILSYEGQKPPTPQFHSALSQWVKNGGALVVVDDDKDPFNAVREWWNTAPRKFATPRHHLFGLLGLPHDFTGARRVGKGVVVRVNQSPAALAQNPNGAERVRVLARQAAAQIGLPWSESNAMILRRGPYVVAAGLDESLPNAPMPTLRGAFVNLFDANLSVLTSLEIKAGQRALLVDLDKMAQGAPRVLAAACRVKNFVVTPQNVRFTADGVIDSNAVVLMSLSSAPQSVTVAGKTLPNSDFEYDAAHRVLRVRFSNSPDGVEVVVAR